MAAGNDSVRAWWPDYKDMHRGETWLLDVERVVLEGRMELVPRRVGGSELFWDDEGRSVSLAPIAALVRAVASRFRRGPAPTAPAPRGTDVADEPARAKVA